MSTSKKKLLSGFLWNLGEKLLIQIITFVVGLILARKLGPDAYGVVATVSVIISILTVVTNLYTGTYLMRKKQVDSVDMNTAFFFNLTISILLYVALFFAAPLISSFYEKPELSSLLRVMGVSILFSSFMGIQLVVVVRNYLYKKLFSASLIGTLTAGIIGIVFAFVGLGPWALVAQHCLDCVIDTIILWLVVRWIPKFEFSFERFVQMLKYGLPLWLFGIADSLSKRLQQLIIGKVCTSSDLAFYNRGESFPSIIESNSVSSLNDVLLRKVSEEQDNPSSVRDILAKITNVCLYISFPTMFGLAAVANTMIELLLGSQWLPSAIYMQIFCIAFAVMPIEATSDISLKAIGKTNHFLVFGLLKKTIFILLILVSVPYGVRAIAIGFMIASLTTCLLSLFVNKVVFKLSFLKQINCIVLPFFISLVMWIFVYKIEIIFNYLPLFLILIIQVFSGILIYVLSLLILDPKTVLYFKNLMFSFLKLKKIKNEVS